MSKTNEKGFGMIAVLMGTAVLLILAATAFKISYSLHKQNKKAKISLQKKADSIRLKNNVRKTKKHL